MRIEDILSRAAVEAVCRPTAATGGRFSPVQDQVVHRFQRRGVERMLGRDALATAAE